MIADLDINLLRVFPQQFLKKHRLIPVRREDDKILFISDQHPPLPALDNLEVYSNNLIKYEVKPTELVDNLVEEYLGISADTVEGMLNNIDFIQLDDYSSVDLDTEVEDIEDLAQEAPIIRLVNIIINSGFKRGASDIHIEPFEDEIKVRYRVDGVLSEAESPPRKLLPAIITRIKIMSNLDIAEKRLAQDGRIRIRTSNREIDIRVSITPTLYGESAVLRLLDMSAVLLDLENIGFGPKLLEDYLGLINQPNGIILVTGPTGSGKTTTLYATLNYLKSAETKIITIEDPIEYQLNGINQIQVKPEIDFTFAQGLRSILRQDPDVIMIGEIRDIGTAKIAIEAAQTGHLVFATLHTNDALGTVNRLLDMGIEDYLLASTLKGVIAQRLVRVLCPYCKEKYLPEKKLLKAIGKKLTDGQRLYKAVGCDECNHTGYKGRTGFYELLMIDEKIEAMISQGKRIDEIKQVAREEGMEIMLENGWHKVKGGISTIDELVRVTRS